MKLAVFEQALSDFKEELSDFEPALVSTDDAARLFLVFTALERTVLAAKTLVAGRAAESRRWRDEGHRTPASGMAHTTGTGLGEVMGMLENSERLESLPETSDALRRGELSGPQLKEITATAAANPGTEGELLEAARDHSLKNLRDHALRVRARRISETEARARHAEIHRHRSVRMWTDHEGVGRLEARLTPDDLARVAGAIGAESDAVFRAARRAGHREPTVAYAADALVALVTGTDSGSVSASAAESVSAADSGSASGSGSGSGSGSDDPSPPTGRRKRAAARTTMFLRVDWAALRRGHLEDGEVCEVPGFGPVPLATARNEFGDALLKIIITKGVDVTTVVHVGRAVPAHLQTALEERDRSCVVPGCEVTKGLEIDHYKIAFEHFGPTEMWNLCRLCHWHHQQKTHRGYSLSGDPGSWRWDAPLSAGQPLSVTATDDESLPAEAGHDGISGISGGRDPTF
jgi:hypothetical protein